MIYTVTLNPALDYFMNYEELALGEVNRTGKTQISAGGKGIMESRMLSLIGAKSKALGFLGGFSGQYIKDFLNENQIDSDFTEIEDLTRINVKLKSQENETSFDAAGPKLQESEINHFLEKFDHLKEDDIVVFAGTIPKSLGEDFYERLIAKVQKQKATFVMDVDGQKLLDSLPAHPLLIKPNREELEAIFETSFKNNEQIIPYGQKLLEMGAQNVIVSMAGDGALLFTNEKVYFAQGIKGELKNSIGAGDSTVAGFLAEYSQSKDPLLAFRQAIACGTSKAFSDDMPSRAFLEEIYKKVNISEVK
ncbi:MAG: 1-phosphofructokinase [Lactococcus lactis]|jgi:1-phosphofructokinase|uniref:Tagatose-6-phosphate kinase n=1 Tax=Lactococcus lactis subsp. lactis TaxID=1360 RepID=A0A0V8CNR4_LACLL|nr:1-phosphofructokinase [Lactococcus lactis]KSU02964.1 Tagatose-6-phosphate kinase / 1-phosphofructokinase [Lactococcus lactis subsp. lactis]MBS7066870.1 1-phosphofructokinase [Lactococcus lactis]MCT0016236.1 1-phosphofructokinase [Lactococcus lactis subsp. lactis]MCT1171521.1 1-phosphofructokinase [Lactococcus lactis]MDR0318168.1 1-phosphofructokinase [Lactococcus lactis]